MTYCRLSGVSFSFILGLKGTRYDLSSLSLSLFFPFTAD